MGQNNVAALTRFIYLFLSSKTSNLCDIIGVEYGIPKQGSHSTDKKSVGKRECCVCEGGMYMYYNNQMRNKLIKRTFVSVKLSVT